MLDHLPRMAATLAALGAFTAWAQPTPAPAAPRMTPPEYRSVLEGYQRHGEQEIAPWRESNDTVGRIGGWRAYANEATGGASSPARGASAPAAGSGNAPATGRDPHAGHKQ